MAISKGDFVEIEYTGKIKEGNLVFDTTSEEVAKQNKIYDKEATYKPLIMCVGEGHIVKGLDKEIEGREIGKKFTVDVPPEEGFGKKNPKLLQLISTSKFREQKITPVPGLQVNVDGLIGVIKTVTGGRTIIDFNHPLAGKELSYEVEIKRIVTDTKEKVATLIDLMRLKDFEIEIKEKTLTLETKHDIPKEIQQRIIDEIKRLVKEIEKVEIKKEEEKKAEEIKLEKEEKETEKEAEKRKRKSRKNEGSRESE